MVLKSPQTISFFSAMAFEKFRGRPDEQRRAQRDAAPKEPLLFCIGFGLVLIAEAFSVIYDAAETGQAGVLRGWRWRCQAYLRRLARAGDCVAQRGVVVGAERLDGIQKLFSQAGDFRVVPDGDVALEIIESQSGCGRADLGVRNSGLHLGVAQIDRAGFL